jgi:small-conductance mechanosensitive channel
MAFASSRLVSRPPRLAALAALCALPAAVIAAEAPPVEAPAEQWKDALIAFGVSLLAGWVAARLLPLVWRFILAPIAARTPTTLDTRILDRTLGPARFTLQVAFVHVGTRMGVATLPAVTAHPAWPIFAGALYVLQVLALTSAAYAVTRAVVDWYAAEFAAKTAGKLDDQFLSLFNKAAKFIFFFIALTIIFSHFDVQVAGLLATAGVASLAVAFAAQETLANMIAGMVLMVDRPFVAGDRIQLANGHTGDVLEIGLRSTKVLALDNTVITVPNSDMAKSQIVNLNAPDARFCLRITLGVAYGTDMRRAKAVLLDALRSHAGVLKDPPPAAHFTEFAESALNILYICWIAHYGDKDRIQDELNLAIKDRFEAEGIEIPFPQRDVRLRIEDAAKLKGPAAKT